MKLLITGICGFAGFRLAKAWKARRSDIEIVGLDNMIRPGSEINRGELKKLGIPLFHGDIRCASDFESLPAVDWVLDCAANPSVLAGVDGKSSSRQLMEHNLSGTVELMEYCRRHKAGFILLSTSRVYGVEPLSSLPMQVRGERFEFNEAQFNQPGVSAKGITEQFPSDPPLSLYGTSKRAAELVALEYGKSFDFPVWINRCGVMAGPGQFGKADQGIISFWIHAYRAKRPLKYIGFGGKGYQVRDFFDPLDLIPLMEQQIRCDDPDAPQICNIGGETPLSTSLAELSAWCRDRFGPHPVQETQEERPFDIPWILMDSQKAHDYWKWKPSIGKEAIFESIAKHAEANPNWLELALS